MNKVNRLIDGINKRNFFTFFLLSIICLIVAIISMIASSISFFYHPTSSISNIGFIGILSLSIIMVIAIILMTVSYFPIYKERNSLRHYKLLKVIFWLVITAIIIAMALIVWIFLFNSIHQKIIKFLSSNDDFNITKNQTIFNKLKIFKLIINSTLILNIITIVSINTFIKHKGGI
ncbi:hypothetical protein [Metamycoplasma auris]|uniref:Uncharacterized protein n=1 Tax=Metamycoplasma auris TaxID=51363 RepID=A0A2W7G464_9BACT|nr:hypothetical protein [Metamycoplasma auris]PZV99884.1 hypothetical protein BCF89_10512 [Metamycoplasma auris]